MNNFIKQIPHQAKEPVSIERDINDVIVIEGVRYQADFFRTMAWPEGNILYTFRRDDDNVWLTQIRSMDEARKFFEEAGQGEPVSAEENEDAV